MHCAETAQCAEAAPAAARGDATPPLPPARVSGACTLSDDPAHLELAAMHAYLHGACPSQEIPLEMLRRAVRASLCVGAYDASGVQVGLARFISDYATFCQVGDVYVLEAHRGRGLAGQMPAFALAHPRLQGLSRWGVVTQNAHELYRRFGFAPLARCERHMERVAADICPRINFGVPL